MKQSLTLILLFIFSIGSILLSLSVGSMSLSFEQIFNAFIQTQDTQNNIAQTIIWALRAPRAYVAFVTGGLLSLAGLLMQVLLRNPLADPYILGVSGGASVAALLAMSFALSGIWVSASAFIGALVSITLVFGLSHRRGNWDPSRLLLTGVVLAAGWGAMINFILASSTDQSLRGMLFWMMGDISGSSANITNILILLLGVVIALLVARPLNILARGDLQAGALGVSVKPLRIALFLLASGLTAFAVTQAGSVGFVGLIVPHMLRLIIGSDHRVLVPAVVLLGGSLLVISDTLARTIIAPQQLPVGVITAFIGVPFFLFLLNKSFERGE